MYWCEFDCTHIVQCLSVPTVCQQLLQQQQPKLTIYNALLAQKVPTLLQHYSWTATDTAADTIHMYLLGYPMQTTN
eukprot:15029-Heterococcus_DN1.PRE.1